MTRWGTALLALYLALGVSPLSPAKAVLVAVGATAVVLVAVGVHVGAL